MQSEIGAMIYKYVEIFETAGIRRINNLMCFFLDNLLFASKHCTNQTKHKWSVVISYIFICYEMSFAKIYANFSVVFTEKTVKVHELGTMWRSTSTQRLQEKNNK